MDPLRPTNSHPSSLLLPATRSKIRNLESLSLRNISLDALSSPNAAKHIRGKTIDDDGLPQTLQSAAKLVALRERQQEERALEHSRSSTDLRAAALNGSSVVDDDREGEAMLGNGSPIKGKSSVVRPRMPGRMRRRSTLEWAHSTPQRRQERLVRALEERMVDVFFSLHVDGVEEPIYVSETVEKTMNATFRRIEFETCGPGIMRHDQVMVKVWVRREQAKWRPLLEIDLELAALQYLGKNLDAPFGSLPPNSLLFHTSDGIYVAPPSSPPSFPLPGHKLQESSQSSRSASARSLNSSSFDSLLRLAKLDDSIQDALSTRNRLACDLENLLQAHRAALEDRDRVHEAEDRLKTVDYAQGLVQKQIHKARTQIAEKRTSLSRRRELMKFDLDTRTTTLTSIRDSRSSSLPASRDELAVLQKSIHAQRRRVATTLSTIYPIIPLPNHPLAFKIRDLYLPKSDDLDAAESPDKLAAAFGHVAHTLQLLSFYLRTPLLYPVTERSSSSTILDTVSKLPAPASSASKTSLTVEQEEAHLRTYPLYSRGAPRFRFEYGVFLLSKDIQVLLESVYGVRIPDLRPVLANLNYLLYIASAGEGELPARKAGGIKGLLMARNGDVKVTGSGTGAVESLRRYVK